MPNRSIRHAVAFVALLGAHLTGLTAGPTFEDSFLEPLPVVLTMSRMPIALRDAPGAVTVLDRELIRATGYRDIGRLFRLVPGMQVGQESGNDQWVTYHGLGLDYPNQMQMLIDGRSINSPHFDWGKLRLSLDDIERIEIVRGSDAAAYGSNAFLGVVNILTRHSAESGSSVRLTGGHRGIRDVTGRAALQAGALGLRVTATHQQDSGFSGLHDGRRMNALNLRGDLRLSPIDEFTLQAGLLDGRREVGYSGTPFDGNAEREPSYHDGFVHLRWQRTLAPDNEITLSWYHNRETTRERWTVFAPASPFSPIIHIPIDNDRRNRRDNLEFQHRSSPRDTLRVLWGAEWRRDRILAPLLFFGQGEQRQELQRLFGNLEWRMSEHWLMHGGTMAERYPGNPTRHSPRLFVTWQPDARQSWRVGYSRAYRQPSQFEQNADVRVIDPQSGTLLQQRHIANPHIRPQRIDAFEAGYFGILAAERGTVDVRLFRERISKLIWRQTVPAPPGSVQEAFGLGSARWDNLPGRVVLTGVEYQIRYRPWENGTLIVNHSLIHARAGHRPLEKTVAPYTASVSWLQRHGPWQSMLSVLRQGPIDAGSSDVQGFQYVVPAYTTLDWSIARQVRVAGWPAELRLTGLNLLGRHQELAHRPLQQLAGKKPVNRVERQLYLSVNTQF